MVEAGRLELPSCMGSAMTPTCLVSIFYAPTGRTKLLIPEGRKYYAV